ncbi:MAG: hypothetical protein CME36_19215 [unclassified Hahellaceae]|nr:hypothetical protein [Hahellaceae bacterium]|tara:strand:- start:5538 stop:5873 length:336 start_codon:yes stop_codon:yes gene_type:complete
MIIRALAGRAGTAVDLPIDSKRRIQFRLEGCLWLIAARLFYRLNQYKVHRRSSEDFIQHCGQVIDMAAGNSKAEAGTPAGDCIDSIHTQILDRQWNRSRPQVGHFRSTSLV